VTGSGVDGMIRVKDVEALQAAVNVMSDETQPLTKLRQTIASRTTHSKQTVPHFYLMADVNMTQVNNLRTYCRDTLGWPKAPTYTDVLVRACALTLRDLPEINQHYSAAGLVAHESINMGVAIHTDTGLVAPVIANADQLDLQATSNALRDLAGRAREGRLKAVDTGQKSMVISNLGMYRVDAFVAIIDMPDPLILAVGQVAERVVPVNGQAVIQPMCTLTLSVDHRALDGVPAARFLERIAARLENPFDILNTSTKV
jgi:pyruvate dehydrogenase E2 component (dihydrolipoamide acetyltransferase)